MKPVFLRVILGILVLATNGLSSAYPHEIPEPQNNGNKDVISDFGLRSRLKRGMPDAIAQLLKKAAPLNKFGVYSDYSRSGGRSQAWKDFQDLKVTNMKENDKRKEGLVKDTRVILNDGLPYGVLSFFRRETVPGGKQKLVIDTIKYYE